MALRSRKRYEKRGEKRIERGRRGKGEKGKFSDKQVLSKRYNKTVIRSLC